MNTYNRNVILQQHAVLLTVMEHAGYLKKKHLDKLQQQKLDKVQIAMHRITQEMKFSNLFVLTGFYAAYIGSATASVV